MTNNLMLKPFKGVVEAGVVKMYGKLVTTTSGTVDTTNTACKGFTIAKTAGETGRYTVTLAKGYARLLAVGVAIAGAADAAYTSAKGLTWLLRNVSVNDSTPTFDIQFNDPDGSPADAELEDGTSVYLEITLKDTSAY